MSKHAFAARFAAGKIDAEAGVIYGVSVATEGPARGHGVMCDRTTLEQLCECAKQYQGGLKVKMTHRGDAGDIVGYIDGLRIEGKKLLGDLHLLSTYEKREYVLEIAQKIPDTFGLSVAFSGPTHEASGMGYARCTEIYSCDLVSEPAANPDGLFSAVDAGEKDNSPMTPDEIKSHVQAAVATALVEFTSRVAALETSIKGVTAPTEFSALQKQVTELSAKLETATTELSAKIGDDTKRIELAAKAVAQEFTRHTGNSRVPADGAGNNGNGNQPTPEDQFVELAQKKYGETKSQKKALDLAIAENPKGYAAFRSSGKQIKWA